MNMLARGMALAGALSTALARELRARTFNQRGGEAGEALRRVSTTYHENEFWVNVDGQNVYGLSYVPDVGGRLPLVIFSHGLGSDHAIAGPYARELASHGIVTMTFDFRGGAETNRSDGTPRDMSVMTEAHDLEAVLAMARGWDCVDEGRIVIMGGSQGGAVTSIVAERAQSQVAGVVLLYPAFSIFDHVHRACSSLDEVPESNDLLGWLTVGSRYATDVWDYDFYQHMSYEGPVLIIHGSDDSVIPISYSRRAARTYRNCEYHTIRHGTHGFSGPAYDEAMSYLLDFVARVCA